VNGATMRVVATTRRAPLQFPRGSADSGAERSVAPARLDNMTKQVSRRGERARRDDRYRLRSILWNESTLTRIQACGRRRINGDKVRIYRRDDRAHFTNVQACGSVHSCPVCAPKVRQRRADEIDKAVRAHLDAGGFALFQTFTLPHDFGDELTHLLESVANAFRKVIAGRGYIEDKRDYAITGSIRASETTFGKAGAHPHLHVIFFCDRQLTPGEVLTLNGRLFARWSSAVEAAGYRAPLIGLCPIEKVTARELGAYVTKMAMTEDTDRRVGMEMTRHDLKAARRKGRTPFQVLRDFSQSGDCADLELWREWERASRGTQSLTWSKGLKARFSVGDKTDEELAAEEVGGELIAELSVDQWNLVNADGCALTLLNLAEDYGTQEVEFWLFVLEDRQRVREARCLRATAA
jgi:hypothetical protein